MAEPHRVQLSRKKGWKMPENTVKVDRTTKWGNPFVKHGDGYPMSRSMAVSSFRSLLKQTGAWWPFEMKAGKVPAAPPTTVDDARRELRGKNLACWCPLDEPCHADVLLKIANEQPAENGDRRDSLA